MNAGTLNATLGAYAGAGPRVVVTTATNPQELASVARTVNLEVGIGPVKGSVSVSWNDDGVVALTIGPPVPGLSPGIGAAASYWETSTAVLVAGGPSTGAQARLGLSSDDPRGLNGSYDPARLGVDPVAALQSEQEPPSVGPGDLPGRPF